MDQTYDKVIKQWEANETINDHSHWETLFLNKYLELTINTLRKMS